MVPELVTHRASKGHRAALIFVHGFGGHPASTWGRFPDFLAGDLRLKGWSVFSFGYPSTFWLDVIGLWKADPPVESLADGLRTRAELAPLSPDRSLALVAHSMGGLVVQRALVDHPGFAQRVSHVILFGTPSAGLRKACFFKFWKRQLRAMGQGGTFITDLRGRWKARFGKTRPFRLLAVGGDQDEFVPRESSLEPFSSEEGAVIRGDHLSIVKPSSGDAPSVQIVQRLLTGEVEADPAAFTDERRRFQATVDRHLGKAGLDQDALVELALALEGVGRPEDAIALLERGRKPSWLDATRTLACSLQRRWLTGRRRADAERALELHGGAYAEAVEGKAPDAALYHGINVAFLELAYRGRHAAAEAMAERVLQHVEEGPQDTRWALAAAGEAHLLLGRREAAVECYTQVLKTAPLKREDRVRQALSMYQRATRVASLIGDRQAAAMLELVFRGAED